MAKLDSNRHTLKLLEQFTDRSDKEAIRCWGISYLEDGRISVTNRHIVLLTKPTDLRAIEKELEQRRIASLVKMGIPKEDIAHKEIKFVPDHCYDISDGSDLGPALDSRKVLCADEEHKKLEQPHIIASMIRMFDEASDKAKKIKSDHMVDPVVKVMANGMDQYFAYKYIMLAYRTLEKLGYKMCKAVRYNHYLCFTAGSTSIVIFERYLEKDDLVVETIMVPKYVAPEKPIDLPALVKDSSKKPKDAKPKGKNAKPVKKP